MSHKFAILFVVPALAVLAWSGRAPAAAPAPVLAGSVTPTFIQDQGPFPDHDSAVVYRDQQRNAGRRAEIITKEGALYVRVWLFSGLRSETAAASIGGEVWAASSLAPAASPMVMDHCNRCGPFDSRLEADRAATSARAEGFSVDVICVDGRWYVFMYDL